MAMRRAMTPKGGLRAGGLPAPCGGRVSLPWEEVRDSAWKARHAEGGVYLTATRRGNPLHAEREV